MIEEYLKKFRRNLNLMIRLITKYRIPVEITTLVTLENKIPFNISLAEVFSIDIENLTFNINKKLTGCLPNNVTDYVIHFRHNIDINRQIDYQTDDFIEKYLFEIEITGYNQQAEEYYFAWHLDNHNFEGETNLTHPVYHFQNWSDRLNHVLDDPKYGKILLMNSPRFPHPPMDLFLGIHFIINNFMDSGEVSGKLDLMQNAEYQGIIMDSQSLIWDIYFNSFSPACTHNHFNKSKVFPLYVN